MTLIKILISTVLGIFICLVMETRATAAFIPIPQPNAAYLASTTLIPITAPDLTVINSLSDATLTASFSTGLQARTVPTTWATWSSPPNSETPTPRVLKTPGLGSTLLTLTFSKPLSIFGLEAEPDPDVNNPIFNMTATFYNGATLLGTISMPVGGNAGARLFAAQVTSPTGPITSMDITAGTTDFAIAQLRYQLAPASTSVPEPGTWMGLATGLVALLGYRRLRHSS